ncbi:hypothetical protein F3Y22_tig00010865pilonHSYRG00014 [Hibiscus syriacus]|uniref:Expansin-like CBD domain-containing protein n=1 Tax=Hibiscus syriacus TaxID=106335 RepID=A0A6A3C6N5_HIBSY|nr:hypothetical protein F3Y22_tig00010865pilonHSYRG00014 [Hibiscus syriacus]
MGYSFKFHCCFVSIIVLSSTLCYSQDDFVKTRPTYYGSPDCLGTPMVTDYGEGDNTNFILSPRAYCRLAQSDKAGELYAYGVVEVEYKRIPSYYGGYKLQFKADCKEWIDMRRAYGAVFDMTSPPSSGYVSLRFQVSRSAGVYWVEASNALPSN